MGGTDSATFAAFVSLGVILRSRYSVLLSMRGSGLAFQFVGDDVVVGIDADVARDFEALAGDGERVHLGVVIQRARGGQRKHPAGADGSDAVFRLDHVAVAGEDEGAGFVGDDEHGFEAAQHAVGAPVFGEFDRCAQQLPVLFFQLAFKTLEKGEGVGGAAGKSGEDTVFIETADFARVALHDGVAERDLAVTGDGDVATTTDGEDGGRMCVKHDLPWVGECPAVLGAGRALSSRAAMRVSCPPLST